MTSDRSQPAMVVEAEGIRSGPGALEPGETYEYGRIVTEEMSARHLGSGTVGVLATPIMVSMMEGASMQCAQPYLGEDQTTVGYIVNIRHLAPTPIGAEVRARSVIKAVEGTRITFLVTCFEGAKKVGDGEHVRVVIDSASFVQGATGSS